MESEDARNRIARGRFVALGAGGDNLTYNVSQSSLHLYKPKRWLHVDLRHQVSFSTNMVPPDRAKATDIL